MSNVRRSRIAILVAWLAAAGWLAAALTIRPRPIVALPALALIGGALLYTSRQPPLTPPVATLVSLLWTSRSRLRRAASIAIATLVLVAVVHPPEEDVGRGRLFLDQTYHHQALRALNDVVAHGADVSEVLEATKHIRAGDAQGWYTAWTALGDRNLARAHTTRDPESRGEALLRASSYYSRAEFFLPPDDPKRAPSFERSTQAFYAGLGILGVEYEKVRVPYGEHHLNALFYPAPSPRVSPLLVFCGGYDSTLEELYFFLVAAARSRGYSVLTFEGPGQGSVLREQGLPLTHEWEKPTSAVLDAYIAGHPRPSKMVIVGLSLGGYLAARAAAFEPRLDGVVSYDVFFDGGAVAKRDVPGVAYTLRDLGLERVVDFLARVRGRFNPGVAWGLSNGRWALGASSALGVVDALSAYSLRGVADRIQQDVLVFAGEDDQFIPVEQVEQYRAALVRARSVTTKVYDRASGGAEHSQLGAPTLWQADLFDWLAEKFGP